jgi:hypothetical protein
MATEEEWLPHSASYLPPPSEISGLFPMRAVAIGPGVAEEDVVFGSHDRSTDYIRCLVLHQVMLCHLECDAQSGRRRLGRDYSQTAEVSKGSEPSTRLYLEKLPTDSSDMLRPRRLGGAFRM